MSVTGKKGIGIPIILLHDAEGSLVTIELKNGLMYRGILEEAEDNMNCTVKVCNLVDVIIYILLNININIDSIYLHNLFTNA